MDKSKAREEMIAAANALEEAESARVFPLGQPILARLDGKSFSRMTAQMAKPFEHGFGWLMVETAKSLVTATGAVSGYTVSDEITLVFAPDTDYLGRRVCKLTSLLAAMATSEFQRRLNETSYLRGHVSTSGVTPLFDCRVWAVPLREDAVDAVLCRVSDGARNAVSMAAHARFGHAAILGKSTGEQRQMLADVGIDMAEYPAHFRYGTYLLRESFDRTFPDLAKLPEKHHARQNPGMVFRRSTVVERTLHLARDPDPVARLFALDVPTTT